MDILIPLIAKVNHVKVLNVTGREFLIDPLLLFKKILTRLWIKLTRMMLIKNMKFLKFQTTITTTSMVSRPI